MNENYQQQYSRRATATREQVSVDQGLRSYMLRVYNYMASGVLLTGIVALFTAQSETMLNLIFGSGLAYVVIFAPFAFVLVLSFGINKMKASTAQALFWIYSGVMGLSLASIFLVYSGESIARVFFITAAAFAGLSLYGYTTKKDLSGFGTFLIMGVIGLLVAMVVNLFLQSSGMQMLISVIGVLLFAGLTAYDTQRIKDMYYAADSSEVAAKKSVMGALSLYLDFINMFLFLLRLFGNRQ